jgi:hypothetical protein
MATGAVVARILTQYSDKGSKAAQKDINKLGRNIDAFAKKSARAFGVAAAASAFFAVKIGKDAVDAAIADQKSQVLLANSLRNTVGANDAVIASTETYITAMQKQFNVVDDDLRPAMAALTAATGSVTAAQSLMQTALDVSANRTVDLGTAINAIIAGTRGQFRALGKLVPGLDAATLATKDYGLILDKVSKLTAGSAAKRAQTLEYRLIGLRIAFGEILETLGYALLPVLDKFVTVVTKKILPAMDAFVAVNKDKLAASFAIAAEFAVILLGAAVNFGNWVANNMGLVKGMAILIAGMFVVGRISAFIVMLGALTSAFAVLRTTAAGAAIATAFATGGVSVGTAVTALAGIAAIGLSTKNLFDMANGKNTSSGAGGAGSGKYNSISGVLGSTSSTGTTLDTTNTALDKFLAGLTGNTKALKVAKTMQDKINAEAVKQNLARQAKLSGSSTIAIGGSGSNLYMPKSGVNVAVNVAGSISTEEDIVKSIVDGIQRINRRGGSNRFTEQVML